MTEGMSGVLNLATVGALDLGKASDIVTDGLTAMGLSASDVGDFTDMMSATITNANTSVELMGETMKYVGPVAGSLGIEMEDLSVAIGLMGNSGIKGSQAGTALRGGLTKLIKPTKESAEAMAKYGIEVQKNEDGTVNLAGTIDNLRTNMGGLDAATQAQALATIFGQEAMSGWASIINATDSDLTNLTSAVNGSTKAMQYWKDEMKKAGMSAEDIEKNLLALDQVFEETQLTAKSLGLSSTDLAKSITLLGADGKVAAKDVNELLDVFKNLQNPSKEAQKELSNLGIELVKFDNGSIDLNSTLESLRGGLSNLSEEE
ncbi:MAG: phage tail tape measure protein, partial [Clostridium sp.]